MAVLIDRVSSLKQVWLTTCEEAFITRYHQLGARQQLKVPLGRLSMLYRHISITECVMP